MCGHAFGPPFLLINLIGASFAGYFFPRMNKLVVESKEGKRFIGFFFGMVPIDTNAFQLTVLCTFSVNTFVSVLFCVVNS